MGRLVTVMRRAWTRRNGFAKRRKRTTRALFMQINRLDISICVPRSFLR